MRVSGPAARGGAAALDPPAAADLLLGLGLIGADAVVDGDVTVWGLPRRNHNLVVRGPGGSGFFIKQAGDPGPEGDAAVRAEAAFLAFCHGEPAAREVAGLVPRPEAFDEAAGVLVLELVRDAVPLRACCLAHEPGPPPVAVWRELGAALGTLHRTFRRPGPADDPRLAWLPRAEPWALSFHEPGVEHLAHLSPAHASALRVIQSEPGFADRLGGLRPGWRAETVIHNDIKSDNVLVLPARPATAPGAEAGPTVVRLVDWELVQVGDPAWDLAGVLHDAALLWVDSMPAGAGDDLDRAADTAGFPPASMRAGLRAAWGGYLAAAGLPDNAADALLSRAVRYSAARLVQAVYEDLYGAERLTSRSVLALQLAANILADPVPSRTRLYGLPPGPVGR